MTHRYLFYIKLINKIFGSKFTKTHFLFQALAVLTVVTGFRTVILGVCFRNGKMSLVRRRSVELGELNMEGSEKPIKATSRK